MAAGLVSEDSEQMERIRLMRIERQRLAAEPFSLGKAACAMIVERRHERLCKIRHVPPNA